MSQRERSAMEPGSLLATVVSRLRGAWTALGGRWDAIPAAPVCRWPLVCSQERILLYFFLSVGFIQTICND